MPRYLYTCNNATCKYKPDNLLNITHSIHDSPHKTCPDCQSDSLKPFITAVPFVLTGNGWVQDNYDKQDSAEQSNVKD